MTIAQKKDRTIRLLMAAGAIMLFFIMSCEDYTEQVYKMTEVEQAACDRLSDTLVVEQQAGDLRVLGPLWQDDHIAATLAGNERIGISWYDADMVREPDVFIFTQAGDTVGALAVTGFDYDADSKLLDSIVVVTVYNADGNADLTDSVTTDTLLIPDANTHTVYIDLQNGIVSGDDDWVVKMESNSLSLAADAQVHRLENSVITDLTTVPSGDYYGDGPGYGVAIAYLSAHEFVTGDRDSLLHIELANDNNAGYMLFDVSTDLAGSTVFYTTTFMTVGLWNDAGEALTPTNKAISTEAVAYCPAMRTRMVYDLPAGRYLMEFIPDEGMASLTFKLGIMGGE